MTKAAPQFRQCHLKMLRSLYDTDPSADDDQAAGDISMDGGASNAQDADVEQETWDRIQKFIDQRADYRPRKQRQTHWAALNTESQSRLDALFSAEQEKKRSKRRSAKKMRETPSRTPLLNVARRPSTPVSLTPLTSNKREMPTVYDGAITSWSFINSMVQKRAKLCTASCEEFRSQSFFEELHDECNVRVKLLHAKLEQAKHHGTSSEVVSSASAELGTTPYYFFRDYYCLNSHSHLSDAQMVNTEELINEIQIKLCLWSNLLASVKEIVDEK